MERVADQEHAPQVLRFQPVGNCDHGGMGRTALGLHHDSRGGNPTRHQVMPAYRGLTGGVPPPHPSGDHDAWCQPFAVELKRVIQSGSEHRGGPPVVLGCAQHHDRIDRTPLVLLAYDQNHH
jgi:hypothetical protein